MDFQKDPIGYAICDYVENGFTENITVSADSFDDDILPVAYLFRTFDLMPEIEQKALEMCRGKILDVGAAAGCHAYYLKEKGKNVFAIDTSAGAITHLNQLDINCAQKDFFTCDEQYDTLLILMNGIGIAGTMERLPLFLSQIKKCMAPNGVAICDSTDLSYLYQEEDGSVWIDLNGSYFGEMQFQMHYKNVSTDWFDWLYIEFDLLKEAAEKAGLKCTKIMDGPSNNYLVSLTHI